MPAPTQPQLRSGDLRYHHRAAGRASTARPGRVATAKASLPRHRGLVFLLASPAGRPCRPGCRVCRCGSHPGTGSWRADPARGLRAAPDRLAAAGRRAGRRCAGHFRNHSAVPGGAAGCASPCGVKAGAVWRNRAAARLFRLGGRPGGRRFGHGARVGLFRRRLWCAIAPAGARCRAAFRGGQGPALDCRAEPGGPFRARQVRDRPQKKSC